MNLADIAALAEILDPQEENDELVQNPYKGSALAPGDIGGKVNKELAKPYTQLNVIGSRQNKQEQQQAEQKQSQSQQSQKSQKDNTANDIWKIDEIQVVPKSQNETRIRPEIDVLYKQAIGTEDVYGGWSNLDPSSTNCQFLLLKISLPQSKLQEISLEVQKQVIVVQTTKYYLNYIPPYPIKEKEGKAKWISDKEQLELTLPIIREEYF